MKGEDARQLRDVLILRKPDKQAQAQAKKRKLGLVIAEGSLAEVQFKRALIVAPGTIIPWDLVRHGFHFLQHHFGATAKRLPTWVRQRSGNARRRSPKTCVCYSIFTNCYSCGTALAAALCWRPGRRRGLMVGTHAWRS